MYIKFAYWMDPEAFTEVKSKLEEQDIFLAPAKKAVCLPLSSKIDCGFVEPGAWSKFSLCRRQLSWYGASRFAGKYLVVASNPLQEHGLEFVPETIIQKIKFKPKNLPGKDPEKIEQLYQTEAFHEQCPEEFLDISAMDSDLQSRWLKVMGIRGIGYGELFREQCANHANFIRPRYYVANGEEMVPYSIGKTSRVCSACLQFFNIIGADFPVKYVVPCPGAALFAGMAVNKYYQVESGTHCCTENIAGP